MASSSLARMKACVPEFKPAELSDSGHNQDRRWKEWLKNFELVLEFEGVTDPTSGPSKKRPCNSRAVLYIDCGWW